MAMDYPTFRISPIGYYDIHNMILFVVVIFIALIGQLIILGKKENGKDDNS